MKTIWIQLCYKIQKLVFLTQKIYRIDILIINCNHKAQLEMK